MPNRARPRPIGLLSGELDILAAGVHALLIEGDRLVYAADDGKIYAEHPDLATDVPLHWIAGTFRLGEPFESLVEDLKCLRDARKKDWILD